MKLIIWIVLFKTIQQLTEAYILIFIILWWVIIEDSRSYYRCIRINKPLNRFYLGTNSNKTILILISYKNRVWHNNKHSIIIIGMGNHFTSHIVI